MPSAQFQNSSIQEQPPSSRYDPQASGTSIDFLLSQARVLVLPGLLWAYFEQERSKKNPYDMLNARNEKNTTNKLLTRTDFQRFVNKAPHSAFKKLIVSMPSLL